MIEYVFSSVLISSDGLNFTLSSKRWFEKYWHPINSRGYRDYEHSSDAIKTKKVVLIVGDSFVTGHGIKNISDRYANILGNKLGRDWEIIVIAQNGWTTADEYKAMVNYPLKPKKIILSYFINDIHSAAETNGFPPPGAVMWPKPYISFFIEKSYFLNYAYWKLYRLLRSKNTIYEDYLKRVYNNEIVWSAHKKELLNIISFAHQTGSDILFLLWPGLRNVDKTKYITDKMENFLKENNVDFINLATYFQGRQGLDLVINATDAHPNTEVHLEVADLLYKKLASHSSKWSPLFWQLRSQ